MAELLLDLYLDGFHAKGTHADQPSRLLSQLKGAFSVILYDASVQVCQSRVQLLLPLSYVIVCGEASLS